MLVRSQQHARNPKASIKTTMYCTIYRHAFRSMYFAAFYLPKSSVLSWISLIHRVTRTPNESMCLPLDFPIRFSFLADSFPCLRSFSFSFAAYFFSFFFRHFLSSPLFPFCPLLLLRSFSFFVSIRFSLFYAVCFSSIAVYSKTTCESIFFPLLSLRPSLASALWVRYIRAGRSTEQREISWKRIGKTVSLNKTRQAFESIAHYNTNVDTFSICHFSLQFCFSLYFANGAFGSPLS